MSTAWTPHRRAVLFSLSASVLLSACGNNMDDLVHFVEQTKMRTESYIEPIPPFQEYEAFTYLAEGLRDPFQQTEDAAVEESSIANSGPKPDENRVREHLEQYPLDTLKMVGGLKRRSTHWGLIRDADGTIHKVRPGNYAGLNHGKIRRVTDTHIEIVELVNDGSGQWVERNAQLSLGDGQE